jgi:hypothetical protein
VAERLGATRDHAAEAELDASGDGPVHVWRHTAPGAESLQ